MRVSLYQDLVSEVERSQNGFAEARFRDSRDRAHFNSNPPFSADLHKLWMFHKRETGWDQSSMSESNGKESDKPVSDTLSSQEDCIVEIHISFSTIA